MSTLEEHEEQARGRPSLRDLIRERLPNLSPQLEAGVFAIASEWGHRRVEFEREACAITADAYAKKAATDIAHAIRARSKQE